METPEVFETTQTRKRHPVLILILIIVIVLLTGVAIAAVKVARYRPLVAGGSGGTPGITVPFKDVGDFDGSRREVAYVQGAEFAVDFSLLNDGPWGVKIFAIPVDDFGLYHVTELRRGVRDRCCVDTEPFAPFVLNPGEDRLIQIRGVMRGCKDFVPGSGVSWDSYDVYFRILGWAHVQTIKMRQAMAVQIPKDYVCPEGSPTP